jgi:hypothetical protein
MTEGSVSQRLKAEVHGVENGAGRPHPRGNNESSAHPKCQKDHIEASITSKEPILRRMGKPKTTTNQQHARSSSQETVGRMNPRENVAKEVQQMHTTLTSHETMDNRPR